MSEILIDKIERFKEFEIYYKLYEVGEYPNSGEYGQKKLKSRMDVKNVSSEPTVFCLEDYFLQTMTDIEITHVETYSKLVAVGQTIPIFDVDGMIDAEIDGRFANVEVEIRFYTSSSPLSGGLDTAVSIAPLQKKGDEVHMLGFWCPFLAQRSYEFRRGDCQLWYDEKKNAVVIDGGEPDFYKQLVAFCNTINITHVTVILTHWHYDHDIGLRQLLEGNLIVDDIFCPPPEEVKTLTADDGATEYNRAMKILNYAKSLNKRIHYPTANVITPIQVGDIKIELWRRKANRNDFADYQVNNTSIQAYFPQVYYVTGGDMINTAEYLKLLIQQGKKVKWFKIFHHGNACTTEACELLKKLGATLCWYNDFEPNGVGVGGTGFSHYGAWYCKKYFTTLPTTKSLTGVAANGKLKLTWGNNTYSFDVPYMGNGDGSWIYGSKGWWYKYPDDTWAVGWKYLKWSGGENWFYFDKDGWMKTGWVQTDGSWYYCSPATGAMLVGWFEINGKKYYLEPTGGKNQGHAYCDIWAEIDGKWYYFDKTRAVATGWVMADDGLKRYCDPYMLLNQWVVVDDKKYYLDGYGRTIVNKPYDIDTKWYYFDEDGAVRTGFYMEQDGYYRYLDPETGMMVVRQTFMVDGKNYRADEYGRITEGTNPTAVDTAKKVEDTKKEEATDTRTSLNGIDIASYQTGLDLTKVPLDFCIVKATQGTTYVNPDFDRAMKQGIGANKMMGIYHYAGGKDATAEADFFISKIQPYLEYGVVLALDWEGNQNSVFYSGKDVTWCKTFLDRVYAKTGVKGIIYMSKSVCRKYNWSPLADNGYELWCAQYANNNTTGYRTNPWTDSYSFGAWKKPVIYQYSSKGQLSNWSGNLDLDLFYGNSIDWKKLTNKK